MNFKDTVIKSYPTGSRYICNPAPTDTDNDTLILVNGYYDYPEMLLNDGWEDCGKEYDMPGDFMAFRKGEENYIITEDPDYFLSYIKATEGAKALNLLKKEDRISLFHAVLNAPEGILGLPAGFKYDELFGVEPIRHAQVAGFEQVMNPVRPVPPVPFWDNDGIIIEL